MLPYFLFEIIKFFRGEILQGIISKTRCYVLLVTKEHLPYNSARLLFLFIKETAVANATARIQSVKFKLAVDCADCFFSILGINKNAYSDFAC